MSWVALLIGAGACYLLKLTGLSVPARVLANERVQQMAAALPIALLAALIALQTWVTGRTLTVDARTGGLIVAAIAVVMRAPFILIVALAALTAALIRTV